MRKLARVAIILVATFIVVRSGYILATRVFQRGSLPQKLHVGWFYAEGSCGTLMSYQGAFAFSLAQDTVNLLKQQGLTSFKDIDAPNNEAERPYFGGVWKATPIPAGSFTGDSRNLSCGERSWLWPKGIPEALQLPGSFYQSIGGRSVYVLPDLGLVVAVASDR
ncbi:MAG: hypothetical protein J0H40_03985 [Rhizobiales bacterium]|nr:hypothetical protein [Hyphomicrobiales bacterium]